MFIVLLFDRLVVSIAWIAHIVIYLLIDPPLSSFLNEVFVKLDDIWGTTEYFMRLTFKFCFRLALLSNKNQIAKWLI